MLPILIAVASLIPGLGFLMLGRWKSALLTWIFLIPFTAALVMAYQIDSLNCLLPTAMLVSVILVVQGVRAFKLARIIDRLKQEEIALLNKVDYRKIVMDPKNWTLPVGVELRARNEVQDVKETQEFRCGVQDKSGA